MWIAIDCVVYKREVLVLIESIRAKLDRRPDIPTLPGMKVTKLKRDWKVEWNAGRRTL